MNPLFRQAVAGTYLRISVTNPRAVFRGYPASGAVFALLSHNRQLRANITSDLSLGRPAAAGVAGFSTTTPHHKEKETPMASTTNLIESAKRAACRQAVADHFSPDFTYVGIGSGSTVAYVVEAIGELGPAVTSKMKFVPTGSGSTALIRNAGLSVLQVPDLLLEVGFHPETPGNRQPIDIYFDGADEVDVELNCIKGGGACHFQEKLVSRLSKRFICVADSRKKVDRLLTSWAYVPVEVSPMGAEYVRRELLRIGSTDPKIRTSGPTFIRTITDNHNHLIDAPFPTLLLNSESEKMDPAKGLWTPDALLARIKKIFGVLEVGIFSGLNGPQVAELGTDVEGVKPVKAYFGRPDGQVETLG
ncbi:ribose 5-phosphate isomerase [Hypomontagnella submonticulosa]|nr:ribose 5-phosphate isomerase [Hypomontagnella submonticulosa]